MVLCETSVAKKWKLRSEVVSIEFVGWHLGRKIGTSGQKTSYILCFPHSVPSVGAAGKVGILLAIMAAFPFRVFQVFAWVHVAHESPERGGWPFFWVFEDFGQQTAAGGQFWSSRGDFKFDVLIVDIYFQFHSEMSKPQYNCIYCGQFMTTREANRIHIQQECLERPDAALPCACLFCGLRFPSKASLRVHLSRWCKEKWFSLFFWCFLLMKYMTLYWYSAAVQHLFLGAISNFATGFQKVNVSQNKMSKGCLYIPIYKDWHFLCIFSNALWWY